MGKLGKMERHCLKCLLFLSVFFISTEGSDLEFTTSSPSIQSPMTKNLTLRCSLSDSGSTSGSIVGRDLTHTDDDVKYLTSMVVTKNGRDIASISEHVPARVLANIPNLQVTGAITDSKTEKGYIELHWQYPKTSDAGTYKCDVNGLDQNGHGFSYFRTVNVTETQVTISDLTTQIGSMKEMMDLMRSQISTLQAERYTGGQCSGSTHCAGDLQCLNGTCGCPDGHYLVNDDTCTKELNQGAACRTTDQCTGVLHCVSNVCRCPDDFGRSTNMCTYTYSALVKEFIYYGTSSGVITSPNYPNNYDNDLYYRYFIQAEAGKVIHLTFTSFTLENVADYVDVFDGRDNRAPKIVRLTNTGSGYVGRVITSSSNILYLQFRTDHSFVLKGFSATFNTST